MALLSISSVSKHFNTIPVLTDATFKVEKGDKIGLVGGNGSGKTTLFRLITGELEPDAGTISKPGKLALAYMPQVVRADSDQTLRAYVMSARSDLQGMAATIRSLEQALHKTPQDQALVHQLGECQHAFEVRGGYTIGPECDRVLAGLGFSEADHQRPVNSFSGGEQTKAALARVLLDDPDLMLLDEPTNHLDIWAATWLESYLNRIDCAVIIVSHDRYFLDQVAGSIIALSLGRTTLYKGNYSAHVRQQIDQLTAQQKAYEKQQVQIEKQESFIRRYHYGQRAKEARGRQKKLDRMERLDKPETEKQLAVRFAQARQKSNKIIRMKDVAKSFDGPPLFRDVNLDIQRGDRIGLIGPNGIGKTTFLRVLIGEEAPTSGAIERGKVTTGYYDQHQAGLHDANTVLDELYTVRPDMTVEQLRGAAGRFLFSGDDVDKPVARLSGGERARLGLARLILSGPSFLVLDEPTNHLDIPSRETVEAALKAFDGTVLMVTHDRFLLDQAVDFLWVFKDREIHMFNGGFSDYRAALDREAESRAQADRAAAARARAAGGGPDSAAFRERQKAEQRRQRQLARRIEAIQAEIDAMETRHEDIMALFNDPELHKDVPKLTALTAESKGLKTRLEAAYDEWEALEDEHQKNESPDAAPDG